MAALMPDNGTTINAMSVSFQEIRIIIYNTPMIMIREVNTCWMLWCRDWETTSTSLVTLDSTSPWVWVSKYFKGSLLIFCEISLRRL